MKPSKHRFCPDIHQTLVLKGLSQAIKASGKPHISLKTAYEEQQLSPDDFFQTLVDLSAAGLIIVGFARGRSILKVHNWQKNPLGNQDLCLTLSHKGTECLKNIV